MERIGKLLRLPLADKRLLVETAVLLGAVRLGLRVLPFRTVLRMVARMTPEKSGVEGADPASPGRVAWAVAVAKNYMPGVTTCLAQALAAQVLLGRRGLPAKVRIGVDQHNKERFLAHAWVESNGRIVVGGEDVSRYAPLPDLKLKRP
jgi:hypothetical protein